MEKVIAFLVLLQFANALSSGPDVCPDVKTADNFDLNSYMQGIWYEHARYPNGFQDADFGTVYKGYRLKDNVYRIKLAHRPKYFSNFIEVDISLDSSYNKTGKLLYNISSYGKERTTISLKPNILLFDPSNYVIVYSCNYNTTERVKTELAWIGFRTKTFEPKVKKTVDEFIKSSNVLDYNKFEWIDHTNRNNGF